MAGQDPGPAPALLSSKEIILLTHHQQKCETHSDFQLNTTPFPHDLPRPSRVGAISGDEHACSGCGSHSGSLCWSRGRSGICGKPREKLPSLPGSDFRPAAMAGVSLDS